MTAVDHKAEAEDFLESGFRATNSDAETRCVGQAHVHAVLYLADQQRIANLIAYLAIAEARGAKDPGYRALEAQIRERLGL